MTRKIIAAVVGAALTVTAVGAVPARADEDLLRALALFAGVAVVGKVIKDNRDDRKEKEEEKRRVQQNRVEDRYVYVAPEYTRPVIRSAPRNDVIRRVEPRPLPRRVARSLLPGDCLRSWSTRDGRERVFDRKCLKNNYDYTNSLPNSCRVKFRVNKKTRHGYDARCLRQEGFMLARR